MSTEIFIENDRLVIGSLKDRDLEALTAMRKDPRIYRFEPAFLPELLGEPEEALRAIRQLDLDQDRQCILGIYEKTCPEALAGLAELYDYKPEEKIVSIGCRLIPEYWGRGIATSCVTALLDYIKNHTEANVVTAHVNPENKASSRCLSRNGFTYRLSKTEDWGYGEPGLADVYAFEF